MTRKTLYRALNETAVQLSMIRWIPVKQDIYVPGALVEVAAAAWVQGIEETWATVLIREQLKNLWVNGKLIFD